MAMATAIGMGLEVHEPRLKAALTISEDWFEFAIISLAGVVSGTGGATGTRNFVEDIQNHLSLKCGFRPETETLTALLMARGLAAEQVAEVPGWETWAGRPEQGRRLARTIPQEDLTTGVLPSLVRMTERIKEAIRGMPQDQQGQFARVTVHATGSATRVPGLLEAIAAQTGCSIKRFESEHHPSIEGVLRVLKELSFLKRVASHWK